MQEQTEKEPYQKYSPIKKVNIKNFMAIKNSTVEFKDNFVNLKGMNSRGKSATIKALRVLMTNYKSLHQKRWIKWGARFFGITLTLENGLQIYYEKRSTGKSCYEITDIKTNKVVFTTRENGVYAPIVEVPREVRELLGIVINKGLTPNFLKSREDLFLVDTTGKMNYDFLNHVLEAPEVNLAQKYAQEDIQNKRRNLQEIVNGVNTRQNMLRENSYIFKEVVDKLKQEDKQLDLLNEENSTYQSLISKNLQIKNIQVYPQIQGVSNKLIEYLKQLNKRIKEIEEYKKIQVYPQIELVDKGVLQKLYLLQTQYKEYLDSLVYPEIKTVDINYLKFLVKIVNRDKEYQQLDQKEQELPKVNLENLEVLKGLDKLVKIDKQYQEETTNLKELEEDKERVQKQLGKEKEDLENQGLTVFQCKYCGHLNVYDKNNDEILSGGDI